MIIKLFEHVEPHGADVGAYEGSFEHMRGMAHGGRQDLSFKGVVGVNRFDLTDHLHTEVADGIQPAYEWANVGCATFGGQERLQGREGDGHVGFNAFSIKHLYGHEAFTRNRDFHDDVLMYFGQCPALLDHFVGGQSQCFETDWAINDVTNLAIYIEMFSSGFGDVRGVGGDSINDAPAPRFFDFFYVRAIDEYFHKVRPMDWVETGAQVISPFWFPFV